MRFGGACLANFGVDGPMLDQRIKLIFPATVVLPSFDGADESWWGSWAARPVALRSQPRGQAGRLGRMHSDDGTLRAEIAVIGGSGFYSFIDEPTAVDIDTPFGAPSGTVSVGTVAGREVAFLARHGAGHEYPPHRINYRANAWALRSLGVRQVLAPCAVGGLTAALAPGDIVVPDQLVDRTSGRTQTFVQRGANHVPFADPYCDAVRTAVLRCPAETVDGGTMVVIEGPRFSTRAESHSYALAGWSLVNMTGHPEAVLAREMQQCYAAVALVTDLDAGLETGEGVSQAEVLETFSVNLERLRALMTEAISRLPDPSGCSCASWADGMELTYELPGGTW